MLKIVDVALNLLLLFIIILLFILITYSINFMVSLITIVE